MFSVRLPHDPRRLTAACLGCVECLLAAQCSRSMSEICQRTGEIRPVEIWGQVMRWTTWVVRAILHSLPYDPLCFTAAHSGCVECVARAQCSRSMSEICQRTSEIWGVEILGSGHEVGQNMKLSVWDPKPIELHGFRALVQLI